MQYQTFAPLHVPATTVPESKQTYRVAVLAPDGTLSVLATEAENPHDGYTLIEAALLAFYNNDNTAAHEYYTTEGKYAIRYELHNDLGGVLEKEIALVVEN